VLLADDAIDLATEERVLFVDEAVLAETFRSDDDQASQLSAYIV
jgi:hypothetical protein